MQLDYSEIEPKAVACGRYHSFVLDARGKLFSCGNISYGQCGLRKKKNIVVPKHVFYFGDKVVKKVVCGWHHTLVLVAPNFVYACGLNNFGQLGTGGQRKARRFRWIKLLRGKNVIDISAGALHSWFRLDPLEPLKPGTPSELLPSPRDSQKSNNDLPSENKSVVSEHQNEDPEDLNRSLELNRRIQTQRRQNGLNFQSSDRPLNGALRNKRPLSRARSSSTRQLDPKSTPNRLSRSLIQDLLRTEFLADRIDRMAAKTTRLASDPDESDEEPLEEHRPISSHQNLFADEQKSNGSNKVSVGKAFSQHSGTSPFDDDPPLPDFTQSQPLPRNERDSSLNDPVNTGLDQSLNASPSEPEIEVLAASREIDSSLPNFFLMFSDMKFSHRFAAFRVEKQKLQSLKERLTFCLRNIDHSDSTILQYKLSVDTEFAEHLPSGKMILLTSRSKRLDDVDAVLYFVCELKPSHKKAHLKAEIPKQLYKKISSTMAPTGRIYTLSIEDMQQCPTLLHHANWVTMIRNECEDICSQTIFYEIRPRDFR